MLLLLKFKEIINTSYTKFTIYEICSDRMNWGIYFGYCNGDGDYRLYAKQVADSGPGSPSNSTLSS